MGLESKIPGWGRLDRYVHREYSGITKWWEEKGHSRYTLSAMIGGSNVILDLVGGLPLHFMEQPRQPDWDWTAYTALVASSTVGFGMLIKAATYLDPYQSVLKLYDKAVAQGLVQDDILDRFMRFIRLPLFASSMIFSAATINGICHGTSMYEAYQGFGGTLCTLAIASSLYIKDKDPKPPQKKVRLPLAKKICEPVKYEYQLLPGM